MSIENQFVLMPEAQTERIRTVAKLPFGIENDIGMNISKLQIALQLGGIDHLKILSETEGEKSSVSTSIVGMDAQGNAYAGRSKMNVVPVSSSEVSNTEGEEFRKQTQWLNLSISLNTEELKQRLMTSGKSVRKPQYWAIEINKALKREINKNCIRHLVGDFSVFEKILVPLVYADDIAHSMNMGLLNIMTRTFSPQPLNVLSLLGNLTYSGIFFSAWDSMVYGPEKKGQGRRISLFLGYEIDRAALLLVHTSTSTFAKASEKSSVS